MNPETCSDMPGRRTRTREGAGRPYLGSDRPRSPEELGREHPKTIERQHCHACLEIHALTKACTHTHIDAVSEVFT